MKMAMVSGYLYGWLATGNLHPSSVVSFPVPAYGFHSDCPTPCSVCMQCLARRDSVVLKSTISLLVELLKIVSPCVLALGLKT